MIYKLATSEISIFLLASVSEEIGLSLTLSKTRRQVLLCQGPSDDGSSHNLLNTKEDGKPCAYSDST